MPKRTGNYAMGAARVAALRIGCSVDDYLARRAAGQQWCSYCRSWQERCHNNQCRACRARYWHEVDCHRWRERTGAKPRVRRENGTYAPDPPPQVAPHPPASWCRCEWCERSRGRAA